MVLGRFPTAVDAGEATPYTLAPYLAKFFYELAAIRDYPF